MPIEISQGKVQSSVGERRGAPERQPASPVMRITGDPLPIQEPQEAPKVDDRRQVQVHARGRLCRAAQWRRLSFSLIRPLAFSHRRMSATRASTGKSIGLRSGQQVHRQDRPLRVSLCRGLVRAHSSIAELASIVVAAPSQGRCLRSSRKADRTFCRQLGLH